VVLIHGGVLGGRYAWRAQKPLAERWTLLAPDRPGHGDSPAARQDFEPEAILVADQLLEDPVDLVGLSYGGIVAMLAAARRPENVRSLTVIEPPATRVARGVPSVDDFDAGMRTVLDDPPDDLAALLDAFFSVIGVPLQAPRPLPEPLANGAAALVGIRPPGEAKLPLAELSRASVRSLVVSGGHMEAYETICDTITDALDAERAVITGMGHLVPDTGDPFNERLERFLTAD
jgi:pimeloyl-ACP methyl ester carboxylesterase